MMESIDLGALYEEARAALKAKNFDLASELLRQILVVDEDYKDASRLLAQAVQLKRRRWYNDPRLFAVAGIAGVILFMIWLTSRLQAFYAAPVPPTNTTASITEILPTLPTAPTSTSTISPTATPIPLAWKRISMLQDLPRDVVTSVISDPKDPDVLYAGMLRAGIYKSIDEGKSWTPLPNPLGITGINNLAIDRENQNILYAATDYSVYQSQDGGNHWKDLAVFGDVLYAHDKCRIYLDPRNSSHIFVLTPGLLYETDDRGENWQKLTIPLIPYWDSHSGANLFSVSPNDSAILYLSDGATGVYQSMDGGITWHFIGPYIGNGGGVSVGSDGNGNDRVYVSRESSLFSSNDGGKSWSATTFRCGSAAIDVENPLTVACYGLYADTAFVYITQNGGLSWASTFCPECWLNIMNNKNTIMETFALDNSSGHRRLFLGKNGVYISKNDGTSWETRNNGLGISTLEITIDIGTPPSLFLSLNGGGGNNYLSCMLYRSDNKGKDWKNILSGSWGSICEPIFDNNNFFYAVRFGGLQRSSTKGDSWDQLIPTPNSINDIRYYYIGKNPYAAGPLFVMANGNVYSSMDWGNHWKQINISANYSNGMGRFYFGKNNQRNYFIGSGHISNSTDNVYWEPCIGAPYISSPHASTITIAPSDDMHLFLALDAGVFESKDGCLSWQKKSNGIPTLLINSIAIDPTNEAIVYAGTDSGAYVTFDDGENWTQINNGLLGATIVYSIAIDPQSNVYAATPYGVFQLEHR
jgi:photosystem II stability/assembly factor-like uncharacterized protein